MTYKISDLPARLSSRIRSREDGCWEWTGAHNESGYGITSVDKHLRRAHRVIYEILVEPIPEKMDLDHQCHAPENCKGGADCPHRRCVNPDHLKPLSRKDNLARGCWDAEKVLGHVYRKIRERQTCAKGHPYTVESMRVLRNGWRQCRICDKESANRRKLERGYA